MNVDHVRISEAQSVDSTRTPARGRGTGFADLMQSVLDKASETNDAPPTAAAAARETRAPQSPRERDLARPARPERPAERPEEEPTAVETRAEEPRTLDGSETTEGSSGDGEPRSESQHERDEEDRAAQEEIAALQVQSADTAAVAPTAEPMLALPVALPVDEERTPVEDANEAAFSDSGTPAPSVAPSLAESETSALAGGTPSLGANGTTHRAEGMAEPSIAEAKPSSGSTAVEVAGPAAAGDAESAESTRSSQLAAEAIVAERASRAGAAESSSAEKEAQASANSAAAGRAFESVPRVLQPAASGSGDSSLGERTPQPTLTASAQRAEAAVTAQRAVSNDASRSAEGVVPLERASETDLRAVEATTQSRIDATAEGVQAPPRAPDVSVTHESARSLPTAAPEAIRAEAEWLATRGGGTARLVLHPPELGEIAIRVTLRHQSVSVAMVAQTAFAHSIAEEQSDRLAQAFASRDLRLEQFEVRRGDPSDSSSTGQFGSSDAGARERERAEEDRGAARGGAEGGPRGRGVVGGQSAPPPTRGPIARTGGIDLRI